MRNATSAGLGIVFCFATGVAAAQSPPASAAVPVAGPAPGQFVVGADALIGWFKGSPMPPLVADNYLGHPDTQVLLGGSALDTGANAGLRVTAAYGIAAGAAIEGRVFYFPSHTHATSADSSGKLGSTDLLIPYVDAATGTETGTEIALAPVYRGSARLELRNSLSGAEFNGTWALPPAGAWRLEALGGLRYLRLRETLSLTTSSSFIPPNPADIWLTTDEFDTTNTFVGAQVGLRGSLDRGTYFATGAVKVALGSMRQAVDVSGSLVTNDYTDLGATQTFAGGYFALPTNSGHYSRTAFAVVPELSFNLGYRITPSTTLVVGYSLLYASNVVRPGNQIDRTINPTQSTSYTEDPAATLKGPARPSFQFNDSAFWVQGISVGLAVRF